jgi:hypothetical protein
VSKEDKFASSHPGRGISLAVIAGEINLETFTATPHPVPSLAPPGSEIVGDAVNCATIPHVTLPRGCGCRLLVFHGA